MFVYWINLLMIFIWTILFKIAKINNIKSLIIILFIQLYLILAFRDISVGADSISYINIFELTKDYPFLDFGFSRHEPGYIFLNKVLGFIDSHQLFIAIMAFIPMVLIFRFIARESRIVWLSVILFITLGFYTNTFNWFRQIIAMGLVASSYQYVKNDDAKRFFVYVILASLFHVSALAFLPVYFLRKAAINIKTIIVYFFIAILTYLFSGTIINNFLGLVSNFDYTIESRGGPSLLILYIVILVIGLYYKRSFLYKNQKSIVLYHIIFLAVIFQILALDFALMTRTTRYFSLFFIIFIPNIIDSIRDKKKVVFGIYILICFTILFYYYILSNDGSSIVPYEVFF